MAKIIIHTDGSCIGNPGPGGWAATLQLVDSQGDVKAEKSISGYRPNTTNNQMELMAAIQGLSALKSPGQTVEIVTDSQYVIGALNGNRARKNKELIQSLRGLAAKHNVKARQVRGHSGHAGNELVDDLARDKAEELAELLLPDMRVAVFGSSTFTNETFVARRLDHILANSKDVVFVCGKAKGAEQCGTEYAKANGYRVVSVPTLNQISSKRNDEILAIATHAIGFYDQHCSRTRQMIRQVKEQGLPLRVVMG